ncbi:hypothetical protein BDZ45DRAFT_268600 [Acephala macrosclerotiorum]|nr:hypothetical protein BDZ45DRAFT_268600 [Acephala macrosclerotiorum]
MPPVTKVRSSQEGRRMVESANPRQRCQVPDHFREQAHAQMPSIIYSSQEREVLNRQLGIAVELASLLSRTELHYPMSKWVTRAISTRCWHENERLVYLRQVLTAARQHIERFSSRSQFAIRKYPTYFLSSQKAALTCLPPLIFNTTTEQQEAFPIL